MKVLTRSRYGAAKSGSGRVRSDRQGLLRNARRSRPFLTEHADNIRLRYYKGGEGPTNYEAFTNDSLTMMYEGS